MKIVSIVSRYLLGLIFTVFGLNGFLNFIHQPPPANPLAIQFFVPLALTLLAAELYNILAFHLTLAPATIGPALVATVLWAFVLLQYRTSFKGVLAANVAPER